MKVNEVIQYCSVINAIEQHVGLHVYRSSQKQSSGTEID